MRDYSYHNVGKPLSVRFDWIHTKCGNLAVQAVSWQTVYQSPAAREPPSQPHPASAGTLGAGESTTFSTPPRINCKNAPLSLGTSDR